MNVPKAPQRPVPTLTEVIDLPRGRSARPPGPAAADADGPAGEGGSLPVPEVWESGTLARRPSPDPAVPDADELAERIVRNLDTQIDAMFEGRLQQALGPLLARMADGLIHDLRAEVDASVRELVRQAVANEIARLSRR